MKKYIGRFVSFFVLAFAFMAAMTMNAFAAADTDLSSALASTTAMATDNKGIILTFLVGVGLVVLVIAVAKGGLNWAIAKIAGAIGGKKRRK